MKIAVVGASGFVGRHLWETFSRQCGPVLGTSFARPGHGLYPFDLREDPARLPLDDHQAVLIASARPLIADCENRPEETRAINVVGTLRLAAHWAGRGLKIIFLSSDYVFDGQRAPYADSDPPDPATEYGRQKAQVEAALPGLTQDWLVLRLSKVYGLEKGDGTLLDELGARLAAGETVRVASDQTFSPTLVQDVARVAWAARHLTGVVNLCAPESSSRFLLASALCQGLSRGQVEEISLFDIPSMRGRPLRTAMLPLRLEAELGLTFTPLSQALETVISHWRSD